MGWLNPSTLLVLGGARDSDAKRGVAIDARNGRVRRTPLSGLNEITFSPKHDRVAYQAGTDVLIARISGGQIGASSRVLTTNLSRSGLSPLGGLSWGQ
jgi:hypothetical protein